MLRSIVSSQAKAVSNAFAQFVRGGSVATARSYSSKSVVESEGEEYSNALDNILRSSEIDGYEIRRIMNEVAGMDYIPDSRVIESMMVACRSVNDYALAVRILETVRHKCGKDLATYQELIKPVKPTLDKLGILTPEEMGYDKPEYYWPNASDIHDYDPNTKMPR